jgi:hypothetical protein
MSDSEGFNGRRSNGSSSRSSDWPKRIVYTVIAAKSAANTPAAAIVIHQPVRVAASTKARKRGPSSRSCTRIVAMPKIVNPTTENTNPLTRNPIPDHVLAAFCRGDFRRFALEDRIEFPDPRTHAA